MAERQHDMYEVTTRIKSSFFDTLEEAEEGYFEACNCYEFVLMRKHWLDGRVEDIRQNWD